MARKFIVLCSGQLEHILKPENESAPEADPIPVVAGHVLGVYATPQIAEQAIINFKCPHKHYITEALHFRALTI